MIGISYFGVTKNSGKLFIAYCMVLVSIRHVSAFAVRLPSPTRQPLQQLRPVLRESTVRCPSNIILNNSNVDDPIIRDSNSENGIGVGIDLGTTNSAIAILHDGLPIIVPTAHSGRTMPSVVAWDPSDQIFVGRPACDREIMLGGAYRNVKRVIGTGGKLRSSELKEVVPFLRVNPVGKTYQKDNLNNQLHDAIENPTLLYNMQTNGMVRPSEISAHILRTLLTAVEEYTGRVVVRAVIGVPAYFTLAQRTATIESANLAGISKVKLLREPEAAALAYGIGKEQLVSGQVAKDEVQDELVLVFDLGGGTFDVSMLLVGGGLTEIISTAGNNQLGGSVFDARIAQYCRQILDQYVLSSTISTKHWSEEARQAIVRSAEAIRIFLSNNRRANLALPLSEEIWKDMAKASEILLPLNFMVDDHTETPLANGTITNTTHVIFQFTRTEMERLCKDDFQALLRPIREVAIMSGALLPGDSRPSLVESALMMEELDQRADQVTFADFYDGADKDDMVCDVRVDISESSKILLEVDLIKQTKKAQQRGRQSARNVAKEERKYRQEKRKLEGRPNENGATMQDVKVREGITGRPISRVVLVGGATRMPAVGRLIAALTGVTPQKTINPDEAVALGCAVHAGILDGQEGLGTILNPMQAAILRAVAKQQKIGKESGNNTDDNCNHDDLDNVEYF